MEIWLCRHGQTIGNISHITQGQVEGELTSTGKIQAKFLGQRLKNIKFSKIITSDLNRCVQTMKESAIFHPNTPIEYEKLIREKYFGVIEGKSFLIFEKILTHHEVPYRSLKSPQGENCYDVFNRVKQFLDKLITENVKKNYKEAKKEMKKQISEKKEKEEELKSGLNNFAKQILIEKEEKLNKEQYKGEMNLLKEEMAKLIQDDDSDYAEAKAKEEDALCDPEKEFELYTKSLNLEKIFENPYDGYTEDNTPKFLVFTHGGILAELNTNVRARKGLAPLKEFMYTHNCSLSILKIYCGNCGMKCEQPLNDKCFLEYDYILSNDNSHYESILK